MANTDTDTNTLLCKHYSLERVSNSQVQNAFTSLLTKIETKTLLVDFPYGFNKILMASNEY